MFSLKSEIRTFILLFLLALISSSPLLLNFNGVYWDDWVLINQTFSSIDSMFYEAAGYLGHFTSRMHYFMINFLGIYSYRVLTFLLFFLSSWFVFKVLSNLSPLNYRDSFFLSAIFIVSPVFSSRVALINFPYILFSFFFYLAFYVFSINVASIKPPRRLLTLTLFFFSFSANSILVFYSIFLLYLFFITYQNHNSFFTNLLLFLKTKIDFLLLPVAFYIFKLYFFKPSGFYLNYNDPSYSALLDIQPYYESLKFSFFQTTFNSFQLVPSYLILALILSLPLVAIISTTYFYEKSYEKSSNTDFMKHLLFLSLGFVLFALAAAPYIAVGKAPTAYGFTDRFQLLLPLGFAFILWFSIKIFVNPRLHIYFAASFILVFTAFHFKQQIWYNIDYYHQIATMENIKVNEDVSDNSTFLVNSEFRSILKHRNAFHFYEMNGISKMVFGEDSRCFFNGLGQLSHCKKYCGSEQYNCSGWKNGRPVKLHIWVPENSPFNLGRVSALKAYLKLKYLEILNHELFMEKVKNLVNVKVENK